MANGDWKELNHRNTDTVKSFHADLYTENNSRINKSDIPMNKRYFKLFSGLNFGATFRSKQGQHKSD